MSIERTASMHFESKIFLKTVRTHLFVNTASKHENNPQQSCYTQTPVEVADNNDGAFLAACRLDQLMDVDTHQWDV